jgi:hypothetical protein
MTATLPALPPFLPPVELGWEMTPEGALLPTHQDGDTGKWFYRSQAYAQALRMAMAQANVGLPEDLSPEQREMAAWMVRKIEVMTLQYMLQWGLSYDGENDEPRSAE